MSSTAYRQSGLAAVLLHAPRPSFRPRPHIWGAYSWWRKRGAAYRYSHFGAPPQHVIDRIEREAQMARWLAISRRTTVSDSARMAIIRPAVGLHFRVVDEHGKSVGRRYAATDVINIGAGFAGSKWQAQDDHGNKIWLKEGCRVRLVERQEEDQHSRFSRMLKAAHRRGDE